MKRTIGEMNDSVTRGPYWIGIASAIVGLLCAHVPRASGGELPASFTSAAGTRSTRAEFRLIYVFNPAIGEHLERARRVQSLVSNAPNQIAALGVWRGAFDAGSGATRSMAFDTIEFERVSERTARRDQIGGAELISWLNLNPGAQEDGFILEDATGVRLQGAGAGLGRVADIIAHSPVATGAGVMTEVEFTTWGKMKELFQ